MPAPNPESNEIVRRFTRELDDLLVRLTANSLAAGQSVPEVDLREEDGVLFLNLPAPGAELADVHVSLDQGVLTVALHRTRSRRTEPTPLPR